jgi:hypothetical protein
MARTASTTPCIECGGVYYAKNYCRKCYQKRFRKTFPSRLAKAPVWGAVDNRGRATKDHVEYRAAHVRVERIRGKARSYFCIDCSNQAAEWSLDESADNIFVSAAAGSAGKAYSLDVEAYDPRCIPCHRKMDLAA